MVEFLFADQVATSSNADLGQEVNVETEITKNFTIVREWDEEVIVCTMSMSKKMKNCEFGLNQSKIHLYLCMCMYNQSKVRYTLIILSKQL